MPTVLEWNPTVDPSEFIRPVRDALAAGSLVVVPGDIGYIVLGNTSCKVLAGEPLSLLAYGAGDAANYGIDVPVVARRLMVRAWPAPLAIALPATHAQLPAEWPLAIREQLTAGGALRFRCPDHAAIELIYSAVVFNGLCVPTLVAETLLPTVGAVLERFGDAIGLVISAGDLKPGRLTVVWVDATGAKVVEQGDFASGEVERLAARIVLFICTGNTCRSPMAEGLAKVRLAQRLGCTPEELPTRGVWILSAGVAAFGGCPASQESADIAAEFGADLSSHRSRPVNPQLLAAADDVIAMTRAHAYSLATQYPGMGPEPQVLGGAEDLDDPIGASPKVYRECARTIMNHLERFLPEWVRP